MLPGYFRVALARMESLPLPLSSEAILLDDDIETSDCRWPGWRDAPVNSEAHRGRIRIAGKSLTARQSPHFVFQWKVLVQRAAEFAVAHESRLLRLASAADVPPDYRQVDWGSEPSESTVDFDSLEVVDIEEIT